MKLKTLSKLTYPTWNTEVIISICWWKKGWTNEQMVVSLCYLYYWGNSLPVTHTGERFSAWTTDSLATGPWLCSGCCSWDTGSSRLYPVTLSPPCPMSCTCGAETSEGYHVAKPQGVSHVWVRRKQGLRFFIHSPTVTRSPSSKGKERSLSPPFILTVLQSVRSDLTKFRLTSEDLFFHVSHI